MLRLVLTGVFLVGAIGCGGGELVVKTSTHDPKKKEAKQLVVDARDQVTAGHIDDADRTYGEAYATASESPKLAYEILAEWVDFLDHAGRYPRAVEIAKQYNGANLMDPNGYDLYAGALLLANRAKDALDIASQLIQLNGNLASGHEKRGRALIAMGQPDEGVDELRKAVQLEPDSAKYHMALGEQLHEMGDANKAALELRAALKAAPQDSQAHALLGAALRDQDETDEAKQHLDKAIELDHRNGQAYFELGVLYNRQAAALGDRGQQKQAEAEAAFGKAVKYSPNESRYWYAYGEIYRVQQHVDDALVAYRKAVKLEPPYPKAFAKLGGMLLEKKQYEEAEVYLTKAVRTDEKNPISYWYLGRLYSATHKPRAALENLELFLRYAPKDDPNREKAHELVNQLKRR
ncbi:MAG TPA: tetratricopeptide repeat protein [Kofleriaceae bacterium]|nr:tetratricopeptide repeat protein [Kofleriaceae bacterium]